MNDKIVVTHNTNTGEIVERPITAKELSDIEARQIEAQSQLDAQTLKASQKIALLAKLGITADEAKLLLS